ncbi:MAG: biotin synthase BioB [Sphingomonas sp. 28-62-20]|uniref:biotin synthase BioB n=1 Tax=Sphingomonas sp. 28-62-20 TaxID=1970433 RepID=UPI000BCC8F65|nr:MAG: biotin synthase BioB [Sphingomonas sp. 28-62-20]
MSIAVAKPAFVQQLQATGVSEIRHDWERSEVEGLFNLAFADLIFHASSIHRKYHDPNKVQLSQLLSIKTGGCPEDCSYCPQAARYDTDVTASRLMAVSAVVEAAKAAKAAGASRYCLGAAWRSPKDRDLEQVCDMVRGIKQEGMEACVTLGMLTPSQTAKLKQAGLDYYNHNIDTSPEHYGDIITTRTIEDRLNTIENVRSAGINVCSGGIVGLGESQTDRAGMLQTLANLPDHPESVPINQLVRVEGTPLSDTDSIDAFDFVRTIAVARILMPRSAVRLSAGRAEMADEAQALCFLAGANSIFFGDKLLTTENPQHENDMRLFARLGITPLNHQQ